jgi:Asparagine synthase
MANEALSEARQSKCALIHERTRGDSDPIDPFRSSQDNNFDGSAKIVNDIAPLRDWIRPTALEIARGALQDPDSSPWLGDPESSPPITPRAALEAAILPALQRSPCLVTFSGGRDSSAVLAVAVGLARRLGLSEPIAVTRFFPNAPETDESLWQELVIRHLGVRDWNRLPLDEMDVVGPTCTQSLALRGPLWPPLIHTWPPIFQFGVGGSILTGEGGDELFDPVRGTILAWLSTDIRRARKPGAIRELIDAVAPRLWRRRRARLWARSMIPNWLLPEPAAEYKKDLILWEVNEPLAWLASTGRLVGDRSHRVGLHNLANLAAEYQTTLVHPLLDPTFVRSCSHETGRFGFPGRTSAMRALFGDVLPDSLLCRRDKVYMNQVVLSSATRAFAETWTGSGVDDALVDIATLRSCWSRESIPVASVLALQSAWFADHGAPENARS